MSRRVAFVAGYTAGHINAAIAVAEAYRTHRPDCEVEIFGSSEGMERDLVPRLGYSFQGVDAKPMMGVSGLERVAAVHALGRGWTQSRKILRRSQAELVIGFGGYATPGVLLAACTLGLASAVHEANAVPGRANRLLARFVDRVFVSMAPAQAVLSSARTRLVGQPVRSSLARLAREPHDPPIVAERAAHLLVTGGSLGSECLNQRLPGLVRRLEALGIPLSVRHQTGGDVGSVSLAREYAEGGIEASVVPFIDDMEAAYRWADFVICAAGASTLAEVSLAGTPALVVPLSRASDQHQAANARAFVQSTGAELTTEEGWHEEPLARHIAAVLAHPDAWLRAVAKMRRHVKADAADLIVAECESLLKPHR